MDILVTGGCGFIGSHTVVELLKKGHRVSIVDNLCNSKIYVLDAIKKITGKTADFYNFDLCDKSKLEQLLSSSHFDVIFHFAALKSGADSIKNPGLYYSNNINSTFNLVTLAEKYGVQKIIFSSSATVYGNCENVPIKEEEIIGNVISPYGMTKYLSELYLKDRAIHNNKIKVIAFRYFNPIGAHPSGLLGEDSPDAIPNNLMLYLLGVANKELPFLRIFGKDYDTSDGTGVRDYIHVVDLALGHIAALDRFDKMESNYEVYNLGTGSGHTVLELIERFKKVNNVDIPYRFVERRPGDVSISYASVDKANKLLGWKAIYNLDDCVRDAWLFKRNKKR